MQQTIELRHPVTGRPSPAQRLGLLRQDGRNTGLILKFEDGHQEALTYDRIRELQEEEG